MKAQEDSDSPGAYRGTWNNRGPAPIQAGGTNYEGRIADIAIAPVSPYTMYLASASGGIWTSARINGNYLLWTPETDNQPLLAMGAIAAAPSNPRIVYAGTGEGDLAYDNHFGFGVLKSTNSGTSWSIVSGQTFTQVSFSKIVVNPTDANILYGAVLRGRSGERRQNGPNPTANGVYKSIDGGVTWTGVNINPASDQLHGATDLAIDPLDGNVVYATFWGRGISKTVDGGGTWTTAMNGLPSDAVYDNDCSVSANGCSRFGIGISHPASGSPATLYTGFQYYDTDGNFVPATIWK
jgi:photosystem II stability/assembly factor-like uncharacterized protein